jgi:hypothetical protein
MYLGPLSHAAGDSWWGLGKDKSAFDNKPVDSPLFKSTSVKESKGPSLFSPGRVIRQLGTGTRDLATSAIDLVTPYRSKSKSRRISHFPDMPDLMPGKKKSSWHMPSLFKSSKKKSSNGSPNSFISQKRPSWGSP